MQSKLMVNGQHMTSETKTERKPRLEDSFGGTVEKDIPEDVVWIDDAFYIKKTWALVYTLAS